MDRSGTSSGTGLPKITRGSSTLKKQATYSASSRSLRSVSGLGRGRHSTKSLLPDQGPQIVVKDDQGKNVTPVSLLSLKSGLSKAPTQASVMASGGATPTSDVTEIMERMSSSFSFMSFTSSGTSTPDSVGSDGSASSPRTVDEVTDPGDDSERGEGATEKDKESRHKDREQDKERSEVGHEDQEVLAEEELEKVVPLRLTETDTIWMLEIAGSCVALDGPFAEDVQIANDRYKELKKNRIGNEKFVERSMQTFNLALKAKEVHANPIATKEMGVSASRWDIFDELHQPVEVTKTKDIKDLMVASGKRGQSSQTDDPFLAEMERESEAWLESEATNDARSIKSSDTNTKSDDQKKLQEIGPSLRLVERMVTQNIFHRKQLLYRNIGEGEDKPMLGKADDADMEGQAEDARPDDQQQHQQEQQQQQQQQQHQQQQQDQGSGEDDKDTVLEPTPTIQPSLEFLWAFKCELTRGRNVSCMCWNPVNKDILAVGYGQFEFTKQKSGIILCWSLKNPVYPERIIHTSTGVTAVDFSRFYPNLLGVGLYNGTVAVYDIRAMEESKPLVDSSQTTGTHSDPVWELRWVDKGSERGEALVSVSTDGRVTQWSIKKGVEFTDLMKLKRISNPSKTSESKNEAFISRLASGLCIDFSPGDSNIYLCGTEDGNIHKCSCSYNEQYLENYFGHSGPVYRIRWSPFHHGAFLSASSDWSIRLWKEDEDKPCLVFQSYTDYVADVCWSKFSSTVFGCVTGDGRVDVWDLHVSQLDPIISHREHGRKIGSILFSDNSPVLVTGDNSGSVNVYKLRSVQLNVGNSPEEQKTRLEKAMFPTVLTE